MYKCKNCVFCTYACPNWMCMNEEHPDFDLDGDCPKMSKKLFNDLKKLELIFTSEGLR